MSDVQRRLDEIATNGRPVLALDLDDVLSSTHLTAAQWHNETYGTKMQLSDFYYYHWWKNPYWGTPDETVAKVKDLYATGKIYNAVPIEGSQEGVRRLRDLGYCLVVVTAREPSEMEDSRRWLSEHFNDLIDECICVGWPKEDVNSDGKEISTKMSKAQICQKIGAAALVDDAREHAFTCSTANPPVQVLLFGTGEWNQRRSVVRGSRPEHVSSNDIQEGHPAGVDPTQMSFEERRRYEGGKRFWEADALSEDSRLPDDAPVLWAKDWPAVVSWAEENMGGRGSGHMKSQLQLKSLE